jgi:hypothetical protein
VAAVATRLHRIVPGYRAVAEDLLADASRIDLFGVAGDGQAVIALIGGPGDDLILVARALAQREWLAPRLADWRKLAPGLGLADAPVRALVLCSEFGSEARAAAGAVAPGIALVSWRYLRNGSDADLLLEPLGPAAPAGPEPAAEPDRRAPEPASRFRSGLSESDLGLTAAERAEFD